MLVLSRKEGERLVIGDNITLVISKINGNRVTIGIEAPMDVKVMRAELQDAGQNAVGPKANPKRANAKTLEDFADSVLTMKRQVG